MKKIFIFLLILFPTFVNAQEIMYSDSKIKFEIDESEWSKADLSQKNTIIDKKWTSDCGMVTTGSYDIYKEISKDELAGVSRKYFNYKNLFDSDEFAEKIIDEWKNNYNIVNWSYKNYEMKFIYTSGIITKGDVDISFDMYITVNNGYGVVFQYMKAPGINTGICSNTIEQIVKSATSTVTVKEENMVNDGTYVLSLLIGLVLTVVCYMAYPFIRIKLMHIEYNETTCKKMALWNSIIVGIFFFVLTTVINQDATWSALPSFFYYWINKSLWVSKNKKKNNNEKSNEEYKEESFTCDNCGAVVEKNDKYCDNCHVKFECDAEEELFKCDNCGTLVCEFDTKCPNCGVIFDEDEETENEKKKSNMDKKYWDLTKLKKLLDKEIISKEEFEKEKKKILNSK